MQSHKSTKLCTHCPNIPGLLQRLRLFELLGLLFELLQALLHLLVLLVLVFDVVDQLSDEALRPGRLLLTAQLPTLVINNNRANRLVSYRQLERRTDVKKCEPWKQRV